ncbi:MAG: RDD family protein [Alphaproteobacteria bacterium]|nr:RDD family protein [Alphaproteobacteria bacterium]MBF0391251.1 RDD family protein [Alphaproteobacteria bacterium]
MTKGNEFGRRFVALLVDALVMAAGVFALAMVLAALAMAAGATSSRDEEVMGAVLFLSSLLVPALYGSVLESSKWQATFGKIAVGLRVAQSTGGSVTFGRSLGRNLAKSFLSPLLLIGYIVFFFTEKRQTLHDILADTVVVSKAKPQGGVAAGWLLSGFDSRGDVLRFEIDHTTVTARDNQLVIGRDASSCQIVVSDDSVSRQHARLFFANGSVVIEDMDSTNGTFVDELPVGAHAGRQLVPLKPGCRLRLGEVLLDFSLSAA